MVSLNSQDKSNQSHTSSPVFDFESQDQNCNDNYNYPFFTAYPKSISRETSECHSVNSNDPNYEDFNRDEMNNGGNVSEFMTTSMDIPDFDPSVLQGEYMSQSLFQDDESQSSEDREECQIVDIVGSQRDRDLDCSLADINVSNLHNQQNGSTADPIFVDDTASAVHSERINESNIEVSGCNDTSYNPSNTNSNTTGQREDNDDCIMGPIHWTNKRPPQFPIDYYRSRNISNAYKFIDESYTEYKNIENIEFLFKCPICYSTITRLRSGKVPNENDKVIYSTKCGHLFCYECIENVRSRKECSICRKQVKDKNQYHVVFP